MIVRKYIDKLNISAAQSSTQSF